MKEGWEYSTIGDLCDKMNGLWKGKTGPFVNVGVIRNANFTKSFTLSFDNIEYLDVEAKQYKTRKLQKGDLIVEKSGGSEKQPVGRTVLFDKKEGEYSFSNFTSVLRIKDRSTISPEFLYKYILFVYLRGDTRKMQKATTGIHNIEFDKFLSIPVPKISLSEQQSIVDYLDSAFAKIDAMKANAEKALNEAKALFQASLKEMLEPKEGWEEKTLLVLTSKIGSGATPKGGRKVYIDEGCHLIRSMNVQYNKFKYEDLAHITDEAAEQLKGVEIQENDVLFNITGASIARCCVVPTDALPARVNQHVSILRLKQDVLPRFLSYILNSPKHQRELLGIGEAGSTRQALTKTDLENHVICYPNIDSQTKLLCTLDSLKSKVDRLQENYDKISQECDALKQAILRQVFE
ncbi:MAG: restriction endonuclease subunit S [Prevotella sp.]|nr:restriction endonuclease subunit S [Prevotella sp.]